MPCDPLVPQRPARARAHVSVAVLSMAVLAAVVATTQIAKSAPSAAAALVAQDTVTQGTWRVAYGADGFITANDATSAPGYATVTMTGFAPWTWIGSTTDVRALQFANNPASRRAATWYASSSFTIDVNLTDNATHQIALYLLDWDLQSRAETLEVIDVTTGTTLDTRAAAGFANGGYWVWRVRGHVVLRATRTSGANAVVSGIFFDPASGTHLPPTVTLTQPAPGTPFTAPATINFTASAAASDGATITQVAYFAGTSQVALGTTGPAFPAQWTNVPAGPYSLTAQATDSLGGTTTSTPVSITVASAGGGGGSGATASFLQSDATTQGNWIGTYGGDGYGLANDAINYPPLAPVTLAGQSAWTWSAATADARALVRPGNPTLRIASTFYSSTNFSVDVNITDGSTHQVALYVLDFDNLGRAETIQALDATSLTVLDTQSVAGFAGGRYLVWRVTGHVKFQITRTAGANAVVSGVFIDSPLAAPVPAAASFVATNTTTQGNWPGTYGGDGFHVVNNAVSYPSYARVSVTGQSDWTWIGTTTDSRALRKAASPTDRIAATLYANDAFTIDINLRDGAAHQVALYALDWDGAGRIERIDVLDAVTGAALDTRTATGFSGGQYLVWRVAGHVLFRMTRLAGFNAVISGLFFDPPATTSTPPTIVATAIPPANGAGWNNTNVVVTFGCTNATSCPSPVTVSTEGANQAIGGTVTGPGGSASTSVTLNIDKTAPVVQITSPADNATTTTASAAVHGTYPVGGSPIGSVTCNSVVGSFSTAVFDCTVPLANGTNAIAAIVTDAAGNAGTATVHVTRTSGQAPTITLVDVIPSADSGEIDQSSEPSLAVNPLNPSQMITGVFTNQFAANGEVVSRFLTTTNGGTTWSDFAGLNTDDKSLAWKRDGSGFLATTVRATGTVETYAGALGGGGFGSFINTTTLGNLDQPWVRTGPSNRVYVGYNNLNNVGGKTAEIQVSTDGGTTYTPIAVDRIGGAAGEDSPATRVAVNGNTVYGAFVRWNAPLQIDANGAIFRAEVVVVRDDNGGANAFNNLGSGLGTVVATPLAVLTSQGNTTLTVGQERTGSDLAIAVDPNNANRVVVAYEDAVASGSGKLILVVSESTNGGVTWAQKHTTDVSTRSGQPGLAILANGAVGLLYNNYDPSSNKLSQHLVTTRDDFVTTIDTVLGTESNASPQIVFSPYLGDFFDLTSVGNTFYGIFSASNNDNGSDALFSNVTFQRRFLGVPGTSTFQLVDGSNNPVAPSIDPFFFSASFNDVSVSVNAAP